MRPPPRRVAVLLTTAALLLAPAVALAGPAAGAAPATTPPAASTPAATPASPAPPSTPQQALDAARTELASLQATADAATAQLTTATRAAADAGAALATAQQQIVTTRAAAAQAKSAAAAAQSRVDAFAAARYANPTPAGLSVVLSDQRDAAAMLQGLGYLQVVGHSEAQLVTDARRTRQAAQAAQAAADRAQATATAEAAKQATALAQARNDAAAASTALTAGLAKVQAAQQMVDAFTAASSAGGPGAAICADTGQQLTPPTSPSWGGYPNGLIPTDKLCPVRAGQELRFDAALAFRRLDAAYTVAFGTPLCITDSYRNYATQVATFAAKPDLAAVPGTSNHGWALAVDFCGGIESFTSPQHAWMVAHAAEFGWYHPSWAEPSGSKPEPWHWEFGHIS